MGQTRKWKSSLESFFSKDILGCTTDVDFLLWPRNDIEKIEGRLFSRWKGEDMSFKPVMVRHYVYL